MPLNTANLTDRERMRSLSARMKQRCIIQQVKQVVFDGDADGVYSSSAPMQRAYTDLKTVWCYVQPKSSLTDFISATRGEQDFDRVTHEIWVRREAVRGLGAGFSTGFSEGFDVIHQINPIKNEYFIFLKEGSATKGRRFQCKETRMDERNREFIRIRCKEVEEVGTGWAP